MLVNRDDTARSQEFHRYYLQERNVPMALQMARDTKQNQIDCLPRAATLVVPHAGMRAWKTAIRNLLLLYLDSSDINTGDAIEGSIRRIFGDFQLKQRDRMINLAEVLTRQAASGANP